MNSETSKWRHLFTPYCTEGMVGIDIGYGGDPIIPSAITFDRPKDHNSHAFVGAAPQNISGDAENLSMFADESLDYVYSSHCIEDFLDTSKVLIEWLRVLKIGGYLCLLFPDEQVFRSISSIPNVDHKYMDMGLQFILDNLNSPSIELIVATNLFILPNGVNDYNCMVVAKKVC